MQKIPQIFPSVIVDRVALLLGALGEMMIQMEMKFDRPLDADRLKQALALALDAEPVLGCRLVEHPRRPYWERWPEPRMNFFMADSAAEYENFKTQKLDAGHGPQLKGCLWRDPAGDQLLLKVSHATADAGGTKDVAALVAGIYRRLAREPRFRPEPNLLGSRGIGQILRRLPWRAFPRIYWNFLKGVRRSTSPPVTLKLNWDHEPRGPLRYVCRHLLPDRVADLAAYGRARQATLNDLLLAAIYRALARIGRWDGRATLRLMMTVDLRRYLPRQRGEAITNLSAIEHHFLGADLGADFDSTLHKIAAGTRQRKADWWGLNDWVGLLPSLAVLPFRRMQAIYDRVLNLLVSRGTLENALTNMGPIDPGGLVFDEAPRAAWLLVPPIYPPQFGVGVTGYAGSLTLSAGVYTEAGPDSLAEKFFEAVLAELPAGATDEVS